MREWAFLKRPRQQPRYFIRDALVQASLVVAVFAATALLLERVVSCHSRRQPRVSCDDSESFCRFQKLVQSDLAAAGADSVVKAVRGSSRVILYSRTYRLCLFSARVSGLAS